MFLKFADIENRNLRKYYFLTRKATVTKLLSVSHAQTQGKFHIRQVWCSFWLQHLNLKFIRYKISLVKCVAAQVQKVGSKFSQSYNNS